MSEVKIEPAATEHDAAAAEAAAEAVTAQAEAAVAIAEVEAEAETEQAALAAEAAVAIAEASDEGDQQWREELREDLRVMREMMTGLSESISALSGRMAREEEETQGRRSAERPQGLNPSQSEERRSEEPERPKYRMPRL